MVALSTCPGRHEVVVWASYWWRGCSGKAIGHTKVACQSTVQILNHGIPFLSCLVDTIWSPALFCLVALSWLKINHSHTCLWLLATQVVIGSNNVLEEYYLYAQCEIDSHIPENIWYVKNCKKRTTQDETKPGKTRQYEVAPRQKGALWFWFNFNPLLIGDSYEYNYSVLINIAATEALAQQNKTISGNRS